MIDDLFDCWSIGVSGTNKLGLAGDTEYIPWEFRAETVLIDH